MNHPAQADGDAGTIVLGWLTKVAASLAFVGVIAYDGISVLTATFAAEDRANTIANEAADDVHDNRSVDKAYQRAAVKAEETGDTLAPADFVVYRDGEVRVTIVREANSLWMSHIGPLKRFLTVRATGSGKPAS